MRDEECVRLLQWALPQLRMRWAGFRKVRGQVCKRVARRMGELGVKREADYRAYLESSPQEWSLLDSLCRVSVSRFYRDRLLFTHLQRQVFPELARAALRRGDDRLRVWSLGCASGEEPYSVALMWMLELQACYPGLRLEILATDADGTLLRRARRGCYPYSAVKNLPAAWRQTAFTRQGDHYLLKDSYRQPVSFAEQDVRIDITGGPLDLVLCRNLVFTYFTEPVQCQVLQRLQASIRDGGGLVIGIHETLPTCAAGLAVWSEKLGIYRKS
jgi:chemotaxis protein methyltransferase CheR